MARRMRNASRVVFLLAVLLTSTSPVRADACEEVFYNDCHVIIAGSNYLYECLTEETCAFLNDCCSDFCSPGGSAGECFEQGGTNYKWGYCNCG
jgi:hypothetical protein